MADIKYNTIYNEDCGVTLDRFKDNSIDIVLTSPPYNNSRVLSDREYGLVTHTTRYDEYSDTMTNLEYCNFSVSLFNKFNRVLKKNGVVLYNISYGNENSDCMFNAVNAIITQTDFTIADVIVWKKKSAIPNNVSPNKLTRITEFVFVFCRRAEYSTFSCNKQLLYNRADNGQAIYENNFNFIEAANNDGSNPLNKATYSSELCEKLLAIYGNKGDVVYDPFMGTGTTAVACKRLEMLYLGSEISSRQCEYANERITGERQVITAGKQIKISNCDLF